MLEKELCQATEKVICTYFFHVNHKYHVYEMNLDIQLILLSLQCFKFILQVLQEKLNNATEHKLGLENRLSKTMEENEDLQFQVNYQ